MASLERELRITLAEFFSNIEVKCPECKATVTVDLDNLDNRPERCRVLVCPVCSGSDLYRSAKDSVIFGTEDLLKTLRELKTLKCEVSFKVSINKDSASLLVEKKPES